MDAASSLAAVRRNIGFWGEPEPLARKPHPVVEESEPVMDQRRPGTAEPENGEEAAIAEVKRLGDHVEIDEMGSVIKVRFRGVRVTDGVLMHLRSLVDRWFAAVRVLHLYPEQRLHVITRGRSPVR